MLEDRADFECRLMPGPLSSPPQGFAGEGRLIQEQVFGRKHAYISRHHITGCQPDDIARHQHLERYFFFLAAAHQCRGVADHRLELLGRVIGTHLLEETQYHAQNHHHENNHRCPQVACEKGNHTQRQEQEDQRILDVTQEAQ